MGNLAFNTIVVLFWIATMSWLVIAKIVPPLRIGEPPNYTAMVEQSGDEPPACWTIRMNGRTVGWAANKLARGPDGISEFNSRVYLDELPLDELTPGWMSGVLKPIFRDLKLLDLDKQSWFIVDPIGRLTDFESRVHLAGIPDAIRLQGTVEGSKMKLNVRSGDIAATMYQSISPNSLMNDELSPQTTMPGLRLGQTWTVPLYSPFRSPQDPLDILQASVEREDRVKWDGREVLTRLVIYRGAPGGGRGSDETRGRMWVRQDGVVLRQEVSLFNSLIQFERIPTRLADKLRSSLPTDWRTPLPPRLGSQLLEQLTTPEPAPGGDLPRDEHSEELEPVAA